MTTQDTWPSLVPGDQMQPFQDIWNGMSRRGIFPVADNTERDTTLIDWLATKGMEPPSADNPLYVHNKSRVSGAQLQVSSNGTDWSTFDGRDTGWVNLSGALNAGWSVTRSPGVRRIGDVVLWRGRITPASAGSGTRDIMPVGAVPAWARPENVYDSLNVLPSVFGSATAETAIKSGAVYEDGHVSVFVGATNSDSISLNGLGGYAGL